MIGPFPRSSASYVFTLKNFSARSCCATSSRDNVLQHARMISRVGTFHRAIICIDESFSSETYAVRPPSEGGQKRLPSCCLACTDAGRGRSRFIPPGMKRQTSLSIIAGGRRQAGRRLPATRSCKQPPRKEPCWAEGAWGWPRWWSGEGCAGTCVLTGYGNPRRMPREQRRWRSLRRTTIWWWSGQARPRRYRLNADVRDGCRDVPDLHSAVLYTFWSGPPC